MSEDGESHQGPGQGADDGPSATVEQLHRELEDLRVKELDYRDQLLRARAELENQRKRGAREADDARKFALQRFVSDLLPVKDSLEKGLEAASTDAGSQVDGLQQGIRLTLKLWQELLAREGVEELDPLGRSFDPDFHEALSIRSAPGVSRNTVVEVVQKGYLLNGRLVRPARVIVSAGTDGVG